MKRTVRPGADAGFVIGAEDLLSDPDVVVVDGSWSEALPQADCPVGVGAEAGRRRSVAREGGSRGRGSRRSWARVTSVRWALAGLLLGTTVAAGLVVHQANDPVAAVREASASSGGQVIGFESATPPRKPRKGNAGRRAQSSGDRSDHRQPASQVEVGKPRDQQSVPSPPSLPVPAEPVAEEPVEPGEAAAVAASAPAPATASQVRQEFGP